MIRDELHNALNDERCAEVVLKSSRATYAGKITKLTDKHVVLDGEVFTHIVTLEDIASVSVEKPVSTEPSLPPETVYPFSFELIEGEKQ